MLGYAGYGGPERIFSGVRFVLLGFDSVSEAQYQSELIRRGATNVGKYDASCTHVIVSGRTYDDPLCVAAQNDGKMLVTELWVDDSIDFGALADPASILYRPVKDLNGISGSESLCICLTGYQGQQRVDIMKMVSLMGARFSKPLIANQVTHLICYKFEGEKYELAKRVNIKLVNHRWLEDCLKSWEILPIDNYAKSGWELEVEAEARNSEEETEDGLTILGQRSNMGASSLQTRMPIAKGSDLSIPIKEEVGIQRTSVVAKEMQNDGSFTSETFSTPSKESSFGKTSDMYNLNNNVLEDFDHHEAGRVPEAGNGAIKLDGMGSPVASIRCETNLKKVSISPSCTERNMKRVSPESGATDEKVNTVCLGKNSRNLILPQETSKSLCVSPLGNLENNKYKVGLVVSPLKPRQGRSLELADIQNPETDMSVQHMESPGSTLPQKRKASLPRIGSKSPKSGHQNSVTWAPQSLSASSKSAGLVPVLMTDVPQDQSDHCLNAVNKSPERVIPDCMSGRNSARSKYRSINYRKRDCNHGQPVSGNFASNSRVSLSDGKLSDSLYNAESRQIMDELIGDAYSSSPLKIKTSGDVTSPADGKILRGFPFDAKQRHDDAHNTIRDTAKFFGTLAIDSKSTAETATEVKTFKKSLCGSRELALVMKSDSNDILMSDFPNDTTEENKHLSKLQQDKQEVSFDSRSSDGKETSTTASADKCKESKAKVASGARIKTVAKRKLTCRPKPGTVDTRKERCVTPCRATQMEVKAELESKKSNSIQKNKTVGSVAKEGVVMHSKGKDSPNPTLQSSGKDCAIRCMDISMDQEKENNPNENSNFADKNNHYSHMIVAKHEKKIMQSNKNVGDMRNNIQRRSMSSQVASSEPACFILSGHRLQRKEFQAIIRRLKGRLCRDSHQWSYQATHFIAPDTVRRTEKFFAAAAAGRWILKADYLTSSNEAGKFLEEELFEWYGSGLSEDGAINLEAPRKWRLLRERTGHGAFYGMRIIIYGECIAPNLDTLRRVVKAGDGTILATSPPYSRFLKSDVDFAIVSPSTPHVDSWVQEFLRHEIPCVTADYLVEYVCKPGYSLERHVLYKTHAWAEKSLANLLSHSEEIVEKTSLSSQESVDDLSCSVCGSRDRGEVMLICGDEGGSIGCGIATHTDCCDPPLEAVPEEDWFCPKCSSSRVCKTPLKSTRIRSLKRK